jgi:hypothetical protein
MDQRILSVVDPHTSAGVYRASAIRRARSQPHDRRVRHRKRRLPGLAWSRRRCRSLRRLRLGRAVRARFPRTAASRRVSRRAAPFRPVRTQFTIMRNRILVGSLRKPPTTRFEFLRVFSVPIFAIPCLALPIWWTIASVRILSLRSALARAAL